MLDFLLRTDDALMLWLNSFHNSFWDIFMYIVSDKLVWIPMYAAILYVLLRKYGFKVILFWLIIMFFVTILASDQLAGHYVRAYFERARPSNPVNPISKYVHIVDGYRGGRFGFPSAHAANGFALATLLCVFFRNKWITAYMYVWATLMAYSRIYIGVHYPGDILVGATLGSGIALLVYYAFRYSLHFKHNLTYKQLYSIPVVGLSTILLIFLYAALKVMITS